MVLQVVYTLATYIFRPGYYTHAVVAVTTLIITYAFSQGRATTRERDLNARTILITGGFTPLGLTLISSLASRGARIIAVSPYPLTHAQPTLLIPAIRAATKNENIFAEYADLNSPSSIRDFCTRFLTGDDQRVDAIIFAHEYRGIGSLFASAAVQEEKRVAGSLATFLITTLLLPALLVSPVERDIRIIHLVNPFYAAAVPSFTSSLVGKTSDDAATHKSVFVSEGHRALRTVVLSRHLQRILNALPNRAPTLDQPGPPDSAPPMPTADEPQHANPYPSNIVSVTVCPGISREETISSLLGGERDHDPDGYSRLGYLLYFLLYPFIWMFAKGPTMSTQTVLHALFLPTPLKRALLRAYASVDPSGAPAKKGDDKAKSTIDNSKLDDVLTEVLKPGALYRECAVVTLNLPPLPPSSDSDEKKEEASSKAKGKSRSKKSPAEEDVKLGDDLVIENDGEFGGEALGRVVWEWYEQRLKAWEATEKKSETNAQEPVLVQEHKTGV